MAKNLESSNLYVSQIELFNLQKQFCENSVFANDRENLQADLSVIYGGSLAPTLFSWWCVNLPDAVLGGQYQASLESLHAAWHLLEDQRAPEKARELLLEQAALPTWKERNYGSELGHDLSSSHHCRGFAAGLEVARSQLTLPEIEKIFLNYKTQIRGPYLEACFNGNPYLVGYRNTNWLAHISGSVLLCEIALAKFGKEDKPTLVLAKANVLRYVDMIRPDGSLPENGDYFHYGVEFAMLGLHAWHLHYGENIINGIVQTGLRNAIHWPLAFTDENGEFWADFGDTHKGNHEASRVVGYLAARYFQDEAGQWLGDQGKTREPLAGLLRHSSIEASFKLPCVKEFSSEKVAVANLGKRHLAIAGGACRSPINNIPHRHYDSGSIIYRIGDTNVIADSGFYKYTDTYWTNFDDPAHERSAARFHNVVLVDGRGHQNEDQIDGRLILCNEIKPGLVVFVWELTKSYPGLISWQRQILFSENGLLIVVDNLKLSAESQSASVFWHLHDEPTIIEKNQWQTSVIYGKVISSLEFQIKAGVDHPKPYVKIDVTSGKEKSQTLVSLFGENLDQINSVEFDEKNSIVRFDKNEWNIKQFRNY